MSGVGEAASLLTIIKAAAILAGSTRELVRKFKNASAELNALAVQLLALQSELELVRHTTDLGHAALLTDDLRKSIEENLYDARDVILKLDAICSSTHENEHFSTKFRWIRKNRKVAEDAFAALRVTRENLAFLMQILTYRGSSLMLTGVDGLKTAIAGTSNGTKEKEDLISSTSNGLDSPRQTEGRRLDSEPWSLGSNWADFGVNGSFVSTTQGAHRDHFLAIQVSLPLSRIVGPCALIMSVSVRTFPLCPGNFKLLHGSSLALARVVEEDDPFMVACDRGDLITVRSMLQNGQGRPTDVITRNRTPLTLAIRSGSTDVVTELLDNGADVNGTIGLLQSTPLQWAVWHKQVDVVRLLLNRGASQDHMNMLGWNTTFFCWPTLQHGEECKLDFLRLLAEDSYQDLDVADTEGWTVLHRVAAFGMPSEVLELIKLGANPDQVALPLRWNAVHHSVFYGNHGTFEVLIPYYGEDLVSMTDERGWTLLHIAASAGHDEIVQHLLRLGADPVARTRPFMSHMPEVLFKRACTPQEVAAAQSPEREKQYLEAVHHLSLLGEYVVVPIDHDSKDNLEFCEASEYAW